MKIFNKVVILVLLVALIGCAKKIDDVSDNNNLPGSAVVDKVPVKPDLNDSLAQNEEKIEENPEDLIGNIDEISEVDEELDMGDLDSFDSDLKDLVI